VLTAGIIFAVRLSEIGFLFQEFNKNRKGFQNEISIINNYMKKNKIHF